MCLMDDKDLILLTETATRAKGNTKQIEELKSDIKDIKNEQKALYELSSGIKVMAQDMSYIKESVNGIKDGQKILENKMDEQISDVKQKIATVDNKGKVDLWGDIIKPKIIPAIFSGGIIYAIVESIKQFIK